MTMAGTKAGQPLSERAPWGLVRTTLIAVILAAAVPIAAGCGGSSASTTSRGETTPPTQGATSVERPQGGATETGPSNPQQQHSSRASSSPPRPSIRKEEREAPDQSIEQYGSAASNASRSELIGVMRSFLAAYGDGEFAKVCEGVTAAIAKQVVAFAHKGVGCAASLPTLIAPAARKEAKEAATAEIGQVRIGRRNAFVLFRPGGGKARFIVFRHEGGAWKATGLSPGTPLLP